MTVSFVRIDDRMIHGQTVTRWAKEYPCDGLIAVNDAASKNQSFNPSLQRSFGQENLCLVGRCFWTKISKSIGF